MNCSCVCGFFFFFLYLLHNQLSVQSISKCLVYRVCMRDYWRLFLGNEVRFENSTCVKDRTIAFFKSKFSRSCNLAMSTLRVHWQVNPPPQKKNANAWNIMHFVFVMYSNNHITLLKCSKLEDMFTLIWQNKVKYNIRRCIHVYLFRDLYQRKHWEWPDKCVSWMIYWSVQGSIPLLGKIV